MIRLTAAVALVLALATPAQSYFLTCNEYRAAAITGDSDLLNILAGYAAGAVDFYAGLACFVGQPNCACLRDIFTTQAGPLGAETGRQLNRYIAEGNGNSSAWSPVIDAARVICR